MTLNLRIYDCFCETAEFKINGIDAIIATSEKSMIAKENTQMTIVAAI